MKIGQFKEVNEDERKLLEEKQRLEKEEEEKKAQGIAVGNRFSGFVFNDNQHK